MSIENTEKLSYIAIGVHGLAPKPSPEVLEAGWLEAINSGLSFIDKPPIPPENFTLAYWNGKLRMPTDDPYSMPLSREPRSIKKRRNWYLMKAIWRDVWTDFNLKVAKALPKSLRWAADMLRGGIAPDLAKYWSTPVLREEIQEILASKIREANDKDIPVVLITHSMGTLITYEVLKQYKELYIDTLFTIGSPLGMGFNMQRLSEDFGPLSIPNNINDQWINMSSLSDPVSVDVFINDDIPGDRGKHIKDVLVNTDFDYEDEDSVFDHHSSASYFFCPEFANDLSESLEPYGYNA